MVLPRQDPVRSGSAWRRGGSMTGPGRPSSLGCASQDGPLILPVPPERVVAYIESLPPSLGPNGLKLRMAAIAEHHRERGSPSPTAHVARAGGPAPAADERGGGAGAAGTAAARTFAGLRNQGAPAAGAGRGLAPGRRRRARPGRRCASGRANSSCRCGQPTRRPGSRDRRCGCCGGGAIPLCPVHALERWLQRSGLSYGAVFRAVTVHGTLERRLGVVGLRCILRQIEVRAAAQAMPEGRRPVRGAWHEPAKGKGTTKARRPGASVPESPARTPRRTR